MRSHDGIGLALVHGTVQHRGISLLGLIMQKCNPQFQVGAWISTEYCGCTCLCNGICNIESLLYAVVTVYISGMFMDHMLRRTMQKSDDRDCQSTDKVRQVLLDRKIGVTVLKGEGGYSSEVQRGDVRRKENASFCRSGSTKWMTSTGDYYRSGKSSRKRRFKHLT